MLSIYIDLIGGFAMKSNISKVLIGLCGVVLTSAIVWMAMTHNVSSPKYFFPVNMEITTEIPETNISATFRVRQNETGYAYYYKLRYDGEDETLVNWDVLEKLTGETSPSLIRLKRGMDYEFSTTSQSPPEIMMGRIVMYKKASDNRWVMVPVVIDQIGPVPVDIPTE
jgi:hypothetical protein